MNAFKSLLVQTFFIITADICYVYIFAVFVLFAFSQSPNHAVWGLLAYVQGYKKGGLSRTYSCFNLQMYNKMRRLQRSFL